MKKHFKYIALILGITVAAYAAPTKKFYEAVESTVSLKAPLLNIDNIRVDGNTVSSTDTNGNIILDPNGSGGVVLTDQTATTVPYLDANKKIISSSITPTELGYLTGTTANISNVFTGDSGSGGVKGLVPAPAAGDATKFLRGDATWQTASGGGAGGAGVNILSYPTNYNPDGEKGTTADWFESGTGTLAVTSTSANVAFGAYAISFDAAAASDYLVTTSVTIPSGIFMQNCLAEFYYKGFDSNITALVSDGSNTLISQALTSATTYTKAQLNFICPSSGTVEIRFLAGADAAIGYVDQAYLGSASNISNVSPQDVFGAQVSTGGTVSNENLDWINGNCTNANPSVCTFTTGLFTVAPNCVANISPITTNTTCNASSTSTTVSLRCSDDIGAAITTSVGKSVICQKSGVDALQTAYSPDVVANAWSGYHDSTCSWALTSNGSFAESADDATCGFTQKTNLSMGTVTTYGASKAGIVFTPSSVGTYMACVNFNVTISSGNGILELTDGTTILGQSVVQQLQGSSMCGIINATSTAAITLQLRGAVTTAVTMTLGNRTTTPTARSVDWSIVKISQSLPAPLLVNSVVSTRSGVTKINSADIATTGTVSNESGDWISGNCTNASPMVCTLVTGIFSATPHCWTSVDDTGSTSACQTSGTSATSVSIKCQNDAGTTSTTAINKELFCIGVP